MLGKPIGNNLNCGRVRKHPRLKCANIVDAKNRVKLRCNEVGGNGVYGRDSRWVLRSKRRKDSAAMKPVGVKSAQVRLNAGVAAGITSSNCKTARRYCTAHGTYYITQRQGSGRRFRR